MVHEGGHQFVAKFSPTGKLIWSTLLGSRKAGEFCVCMSIKVDKAGFVFVSGGAGPGLETTPGSFQPKFQPGAPGNANAFVLKLKPDGSGIVWASYVGGCQEVRDMDMDDAGDLYLQLGMDKNYRGKLPESWFANAFQKTPHVHNSAYHLGDTGVIKVSNDGTKVYWATWIGGSNGNITKASVRVGRDHCPVLFMPSCSADVPTTPGAYCRSMKPPADVNLGGKDGAMWLGKLSADGSSLIFGTYVGKGYIACHNIALDADGKYLRFRVSERSRSLAHHPRRLSDQVRRRHALHGDRQILSLGGTCWPAPTSEEAGASSTARTTWRWTAVATCSSAARARRRITRLPAGPCGSRTREATMPCFPFCRTICARCSIRPISAIAAARIEHSVK